MSNLILLGREHSKTPPIDAQRQLREEFPECFYEWMPRSKRWAVKRRVPWNEVAMLVALKQIDETDIHAFLKQRHDEGHLDAGDCMVVHAFTVQGLKGETIEPGPYVVEAMKKADVRRNPDGVRKALRDSIDETNRREAELNKWYTDQIEQAVEHFDPWLRQLPRMSYPNNPLGKTNGNVEKRSSAS